MGHGFVISIRSSLMSVYSPTKKFVLRVIGCPLRCYSILYEHCYTLHIIDNLFTIDISNANRKSYKNAFRGFHLFMSFM